MTITANDRRKNYKGNGVTTEFPGPRCFSPQHIAVYIGTSEGTIELSPSQYTVRGAGGSGGTTILMNTPPASDTDVLILRTVPFDQPTDITNQGAFLPELHEDSFDYRVMQVQQLDDRQDLTIRFPETYPGTIPDLTLPAPEPGKGIGWNADGSGIRYITLEGAGDLTLRDDLVDATAGAALVGYRQAGSGAVGRQVLDRLREYVSPEEFGAAGDGATNDRVALQRAAEQAMASGSVLKLPRGRVYYVGTDTPLVFPAITIDASEESKITGNVEIHTDARFVRPLKVGRSDSANEYIDYTFVVEDVHSRTRIPLFQSEGDCDRGVVGAVDMASLFHQRLAWPAGTAWESFTPGSANADGVGEALSNNSYFYGHFQAAEGGAEYNATYEAGPYVRAAMIRCTDGVRMFYCQQDGAGNIVFKSIGGAPVTVSSGIAWEGYPSHVSWHPSKAEWSIRLYDLKTWSVLLNGREVISPQTLPAGEIIEFVGFGYAYDNEAAVGFIRYMTKVVNNHSGGRGTMDIICVGDSTTAKVHGDYPSYLRNFIDESHGIKVSNIRNYAQDGATSAIQLATLTANGVYGATDVVVNLGTNDVQNPGAAGDLNACIANMNAIIDYCQANNKRVTGVIFPTWYSKPLANNKGVTTFNYDLSALYRSAYRSVFAKKNCQIVDLNIELRSVLGSDLDNSFIDPGLRDNIHATPRRGAAIAWAVAKKLAGYAPKKTRAFSPITMPSSCLKNGWAINGGAEIGMTADAVVHLSGRIDAGTKADGTQILALPASCVPRIQQVYRVRTDNGAAATIIISTGGAVSIYGLGTDNGIYLDGVSFFAR
ncbi:hypothetical protein A9K58_00480 [Stenotrophomonas maltophilia]|uniref:SGNH hydrolase-type esterase domain-containing protein n=1 Tax=Stenotrophomonas maltophilia TaxID=40324 RepID=A0A1A6Y3M8_STEMA|nr:SGNH/GDSL hydrolase family protein [Stenotrophomonas maltophilia]OBU70462.1 hypothetical protein A9K58_00480 [Stenotrophomonas maltophilia]